MKIIDTLFDREGCEYIVALLGAESLVLLSEAEKLCFPEDPWTVGMIKDSLENDRSTVVGVYNRQLTNIVAYGVLYKAADEADIANIATLPQCRGCGIGFRLLTKMIDIARDDGAERIFLEVRESNVPAMSLYEKSGFAKIGKRRNYYNNPREDAVIMMLDHENSTKIRI